MAEHEQLIDGIPYKVSLKDNGSIQVVCNCMGRAITVNFSRDGITLSEKSLKRNQGKLLYDIESSIRSIASGYEITQVGHYNDVDGAPTTVDDIFQRKNIQAFKIANPKLLEYIRDAVAAVNAVNWSSAGAVAGLEYKLSRAPSSKSLATEKDPPSNRGAFLLS